RGADAPLPAPVGLGLDRPSAAATGGSPGPPMRSSPTPRQQVPFDARYSATVRRGPKGGGGRKPRQEPSFKRGNSAPSSGDGPAASRRRAGDARQKTRRKARGGGSPIGFFLRWGLTAAVWGIIATIGVLAYYAHDLPDIRALDAGTRRPMITLLD